MEVKRRHGERRIKTGFTRLLICSSGNRESTGIIFFVFRPVFPQGICLLRDGNNNGNSA